MSIRILTLAGSLRTGSYNRRVADYMSKKFGNAPGVSVLTIDLANYPLSLYDANAEEQFGIPTPALELHEAFRTSHGVFIASPEYNANVSPLLSNALAWMSRVQTDGACTVHLVFRCSPLGALRQVDSAATEA
jgi:chromate reductase, NAD(P)H dehydrogenase (quinone)